MDEGADENGNGSAGAITRGWYGVKLVHEFSFFLCLSVSVSGFVLPRA